MAWSRLTAAVGAAMALAACDGTTINALDGPGSCFGTPTNLGIEARAADDFVDTFGVKVVGLPLDNPTVKERLSELGARHMLLSYVVERNLVRSLAQSLGLHGMVVIENPDDALPALSFFGESANAITMRHNQMVDAGWGERIRTNQQRVFAAAKNNPSTAQIDVVGPNVQSDAEIAAAGNMAAWVDHGSFLPWRTELWRDPPGRRAETDLARHVPVYGSLPMVVPQNGYEISTNGVSQAVGAKYLVRTLLEHFRLGVVRTYFADLADGTPGPAETPSEGLGLVYNDGKPKSAFLALSRTIALLADAGPTFAPGRLSYTITNQSSAVHHILLQKRNGLFYLALWREVDSVDADVSESVVIDFAGSAKSLAVFTPVTAAAPVAQGSGRRIAIDVSDALVVVAVELQCN